MGRRRKRKFSWTGFIFLTLLMILLVVAYRKNPTPQDFDQFIDQQMKAKEDWYKGPLVKLRFKKTSRSFIFFGIHRVDHRLKNEYREYFGVVNKFYLVGTSEQKNQEEPADEPD